MITLSDLATQYIGLRTQINARQEAILNEAIAIQQIAAPTFDESHRADYVYKRFEGLEGREVDSRHNVYGCLPGINRHHPAILISAHTDTVFDANTTLNIHHDADRLNGPGIGDNSLGVAALLSMVDLFRNQPMPVDLWFVANTREEGLGDLGGIRMAYERLAPCLGHALIIEGMALGRIYHAGIAVRRLEITCQTPGGHSWLHFGRPSAIHGLMRLGAQITTLQPPESPRTTYNIGVIDGGRSVNSIASDATMLLDLRSESRETLAGLEKAVMAMIKANQVPDLTFTVKVVGDRPAGAIPITHPLPKLGREVLESIGIHPIFESGSTDANIPLAAGLPAIVMGVTYGGNAHRLDEYIETPPVADGIWQLTLLTIAIANGLADS